VKNTRSAAVTALWVIAAGTIIAGWAAIILLGDSLENVGGDAVFLTLASLAAPVLATALVRRHPAEWTGPLIGASVIAAVLAAIRTSPLGVVAQAAGLTALVTVLLPAVLAVNHPAVQAAPLVRRGITWCWWVTAGVGGLIGVLTISGGSVPNPLWYTDRPGAAGAVVNALLVGYGSVAVIGMAITTVAAASRYRSMPAGGRPALRPLVLPLAGWVVAGAAASCWTVSFAIFLPTVEIDDPSATTYLVLPAVLVVALGAGIGWIDLMVRRPTAPTMQPPPGAAPGPGRDSDVGRYLSRALADPSIRVLYPIDPAAGGEVDRWMDTQGAVVDPDITSPERAITLISRGPSMIGLIEQDAAVTAKPDAVEMIATGAGLIMETERLMAAARRDLELSRQLASRLLSASDEPRAELRAQLLAGPLRDLETAKDKLAAGKPIAVVMPLLTGAAAAVRTISHGVSPTALSQGGLTAALPSTPAPRSRYSPVVEMTAYLAAQPDESATIVEAPPPEGTLLISTTVPPSVTVQDRISALGGHIRRADPGWTIVVPTTG